MRIIILETVDSTQDEVVRRLKAGERVEAILSMTQTAGRGRFGREWKTPTGESLAVSFVWHSAVGNTWLPGLALAAGLVAAETFDTQIAWPNDLVITGKKVGGILSEVVSYCNQKVPVIGLGLNISASPEGVNFASSLFEQGRSVASPTAAAEAFLGAIKREVPPDQFSDIADRWLARDATRGKIYTLPDGREAVAEGVAPDGSLLARSGSEIVSVPSAVAIYGRGS